ncbi:hypothetical protein [Streptomyces noursei]|uniref:hypothetical protein n=1 Tax=Streptomyces noursei TaxID=1971 RepID=UPI001677A37E|nr:hypothetical protein [Streptomyces noursei]MCZ1016312.1 hypothetical protein [Streptomyces noursei]GGX00621.1 hypothetical protein GCM10010341_22960 [Streptomyces noursei]
MTLHSSFHATRDTDVRCCSYGTDNPPILTMNAPGAALAISVFNSQPMDVHRDFVRALVDAVAAYADAFEMWAAGQPDASASTDQLTA